MSLQEYESKRDFRRTPEPKGRESERSGDLRFVIQKHDASRLHYDFRIEAGGNLKSWAIPKGPSRNPADKRLAIMVEDHPLEYASFEGLIPEDNYGAGTVMLWDEGTYRVPGIVGREETERAVLERLEKGKLTLVLSGRKMNGAYAIFRIRGEENRWLLSKVDDEDAATDDILQQDTSVASGRTLDEIARNSPDEGQIWTDDREESDDGTSQSSDEMPRGVKPMLATLVEKPFDDPDWIYEVKLDGYRALAAVDKGEVQLYSRNQKSFNQKYPSIVESLESIPHRVLLDGEIVVCDSEGKVGFQLLQRFQEVRKGSLVYFVFDLLYLNGHVLYNLPLINRKELLREMLPDMGNVFFCDHLPERGTAFFTHIQESGIEGMIAKRAHSRYRPGTRSRDWLKIKTDMRQEAIIGGYTEPRGSRKHFGSVILGIYQDGGLIPIGLAGTGFSEDDLERLYTRFKRMSRKTSPFSRKPATTSRPHWVSPKLVCEVKFSEWTSDGHMRHPVFLGLRSDKDPKDVSREVTSSARPAQERPPPRRTQVTLKKNEVLEVEGQEVRVTNPDKVYWPDQAITKGDMINYYVEVADYILPHLVDRPQSLHRHPDGVGAKSFFHKDAGDIAPDWMETLTVRSESGDRDITYLLCQNAASLIFMANLGCIEINPWFSRRSSLENPDYLVIDLDPVEVEFRDVMEVALVTREVLNEYDISSFCKTSGSRGIHVLVPVGAKYTYDQTRQFAELIARMVHHRVPDITSLRRSPSRRNKKVYLDYLQNRRGQTIAAPYCLRPRAGAPVSAPVRWDELSDNLTPTHFNIFTMVDRLRESGDLLAHIYDHSLDLMECLRRMEA